MLQGHTGQLFQRGHGSIIEKQIHKHCLTNEGRSFLGLQSVSTQSVLLLLAHLITCRKTLVETEWQKRLVWSWCWHAFLIAHSLSRLKPTNLPLLTTVWYSTCLAFMLRLRNLSDMIPDVEPQNYCSICCLRSIQGFVSKFGSMYSCLCLQFSLIS